MFPKKAFPFIISFWLCLIMTVVMCITFTVVNTGTITLQSFFSGYWKGFIVSFITASIIPIGPIGNKFAEMFYLKEGSISFRMVTPILPSILFSLVMCFAFTFFAIGLKYGFKALVGGTLKTLPLAVLISYITIFLIQPVAITLAKKMTKQ